MQTAIRWPIVFLMMPVILSALTLLEDNAAAVPAPGVVLDLLAMSLLMVSRLVKSPGQIAWSNRLVSRLVKSPNSAGLTQQA